MTWLYRLQQRLAITRSEGLAVLTLAGLLLLGLAVRHVDAPAPPSDASTYEEVEARFQAHAAKLPGANRPDSGANRQEEVALRVDLNAASSAELQQLPGIGPALSERIEAHRDAHGPFQRVDDVTRVRGIGEKTLDRIRPMLYVEETK